MIVHVANGTSHIGPAKAYPEDYSYLADVLQSVLPDVAWHNNIYPATWSKLAVNCVINPLTALKTVRTAIYANTRRRSPRFVMKLRR